MIAQAFLLERASASNRQKLKQHLAAALDEASQPGGRKALLAALHRRVSLCRTLSTEGKSAIRTRLAVLGDVDLRLSAPR